MNFSDTFNGRQVDADEIIQTGTNVELGIVRFATSHARTRVFFDSGSSIPLFTRRSHFIFRNCASIASSILAMVF